MISSCCIPVIYETWICLGLCYDWLLNILEITAGSRCRVGWGGSGMQAVVLPFPELLFSGGDICGLWGENKQ